MSAKEKILLLHLTMKQGSLFLKIILKFLNVMSCTIFSRAIIFYGSLVHLKHTPRDALPMVNFNADNFRSSWILKPS